MTPEPLDPFGVRGNCRYCGTCLQRCKPGSESPNAVGKMWGFRGLNLFCSQTCGFLWAVREIRASEGHNAK